MTQQERLAAIAEALDDIDEHRKIRKNWLEEWRKGMNTLEAGLNMLRADLHQMRLGEDDE